MTPTEAAQLFVKYVGLYVLEGTIEDFEEMLNGDEYPGAHRDKQQALREWYKQLDVEMQEMFMQVLYHAVVKVNLAYAALLDGSSDPKLGDFDLVMKGWDNDERVRWDPAKENLTMLYRGMIEAALNPKKVAE